MIHIFKIVFLACIVVLCGCAKQESHQVHEPQSESERMEQWIIHSFDKNKSSFSARSLSAKCSVMASRFMMNDRIPIVVSWPENYPEKISWNIEIYSIDDDEEVQVYERTIATPESQVDVDGTRYYLLTKNCLALNESTQILNPGTHEITVTANTENDVLGIAKMQFHVSPPGE